MDISTIVYQLLMIYLICFANCLKRSGVYINIRDQSMPMNLQEEEQLRIKRGLMNLFDIPEEAEQIQDMENRVKGSASQFLMDIYKMRNKSNFKKTRETGDFDINDETLKKIDNNDIIVTLTGRNSKNRGVIESNKVKRLWFNTPKLSTDDQIIRAELKLYRSMQRVRKKNQGIATIIVYRVTSERNDNGDRDMVLVDAVETTAGDGWMTLNVTETLINWIFTPKKNRGLYLQASFFQEQRESIMPENVGIVGFDREPEKQPFIVVYGSTKGRSARSIFNYQTASTRVTVPESILQPEILLKQPTCSMQTLYIDFKELNFDWIIAPEGFNSNYCYGACEFPFNINLKSTNHSIVQGFLHLLYPDKIPLPCCSAAETSNIQYFIELSKGVYVLRTFYDMRIDSCGCF